jgi:hypothetical protein
MAISHNSTSSTNGEASSFTFSHTVNAGSDRMMVVAIGTRTSSATVVSSVVFNGSEALTQRSQALEASSLNLAFFTLANPTVTTANIVVTLTGSSKSSMGASTYNGVSSTLGAAGAFQGQSTSIAGNLTTTTANSLIAVGQTNRDTTTVTPDANYTVRFDQITTGNPSHSNTHTYGLSRAVTTAQNYTLSATIAGVEQWLLYMLELKDASVTPAAATTGRAVWMMLD